MPEKTGTVRFHRVLTAPPGAHLPRLPRCRRDVQVAAAARLHRPRTLDGRAGRRQLPHVFHQLLVGQQPFLRRYLSSSSVPNERIRHTDKFDDPNLPGEMQTTITLRKVSVGTEIEIVQEGISAAIPPRSLHLGWRGSLTLLAQLVQPEDPGLASPVVPSVAQRSRGPLSLPRVVRRKKGPSAALGTTDAAECALRLGAVARPATVVAFPHTVSGRKRTMSYDLVIKNGTVVDGTGAARYQADVAIADGKVAEIGKVTERRRAHHRRARPRAWRRASSIRTRITTRRSAGTAR